MKITGFNPSILTSKPDDLIHLFEDLGFEKSHVDPAAEGITRGAHLVSPSGFEIMVMQHRKQRTPTQKNL